MTQNRSCILHLKIGEEFEDCHNAYDEKNTLQSSHGDMWGFTRRYGIDDIFYPYACHVRTIHCIDILCSN